jgi:hypothetical protein
MVLPSLTADAHLPAAASIVAGHAEQKERLRGLGKWTEAIYWRGIATYLKTHSNDEIYRVWQEILDRFPESVWAKRVSG